MAGKARKTGERKYVVADSRAAVRSLRIRPKAIITSPPYFDVRKYPASDQIGYGQKLEDFLADVSAIFKDLFEKAHARAAMWIVADDIRKDGQLIPLPYRFAQCAVDAGWTWQASFVWRKDRTYPWLQEGRLRKQHETILLLSKSKDLPLQIDRLREVENITEWWLRYPERYNPYGRAPSDVWLEKIPIQGTWGKPFLKHECPFPPRLVERMIELSTNRGDWVLDPFAGTGVVAAVSRRLGRTSKTMLFQRWRSGGQPENSSVNGKSGGVAPSFRPTSPFGSLSTRRSSSGISIHRRLISAGSGSTRARFGYGVRGRNRSSRY
jgi:DNA modification methylase